MQAHSPSILLFAGLGIFLVGCLLLYLAARTRRIAASSLAWPKTSGTITRSGVIETTRESGGETSGQVTTYQPTIAYTYEVAGVPYTGQRVRAGSTETNSSKAARKLCELYPAGRVVEVAYDPTQPGSAMLEPGNAAGAGGLRILGILFLILGAAGAILDFVF